MIHKQCSGYARSVSASVQRGFSLMEIMIAVAIMGILGAVIVPNLLTYLEKSRKSSARSTLRVFESAITEYYADTGTYPEELSDLVNEPSDPKLAGKWQDGGYLKQKKIPNDPWGHKYMYELTPDGEHPYELFSYGTKGKKAKESERISVWQE